MFQYVGETTQNEPADYPPIAPRLGQISGYLNSVSAAIIPADRSAADWARQDDPWAALGLSIARVEAEFPGRILADREDWDRWRDDPDGLTWAVLGVGGCNVWIQQTGDLERLPGLVHRGVRLFRLISRPGGPMGGTGAEGDDRGLTSLGRDFCNALEDALSDRGAVLIDLAAMSRQCRNDVLAWLESDGSRGERVVPIASPVSIDPDQPGSLDLDGLRRIRAIGGIVGLGAGPPDHDTTEKLQAALERAAEVPFRGEPGPQGIGIATSFLGRDQTAPGLATAEAITRWLTATFGEERSSAWIRGNGEALIARICGASD